MHMYVLYVIIKQLLFLLSIFASFVHRSILHTLIRLKIYALQLIVYVRIIDSKRSKNNKLAVAGALQQALVED